MGFKRSQVRILSPRLDLRRFGNQRCTERCTVLGRERPWFRKQTGSWYVTIAGEQKNLRTSDKEQAYDRWHKLLAGRGEDSDPATSASLPELDGELTAKEMLAEFLE